jgi:8-oxo-dGTP diphosphatase
MSRGPLVRAAGGVVLRQAAGGETEVLLVYRARREDWTFPKGKVAPGETDEACALREVEEETGLRCALAEPLPSTAYVDRKGRDKVVRYWVMFRLAGEAAPCAEVDAVRWVSLPRAALALTHARDRAVLEPLTAAPRS